MAYHVFFCSQGQFRNLRATEKGSVFVMGREQGIQN